MPTATRSKQGGVKRMNYSNFEQGQIIIAPISFSNQIGAKIRPALVMSMKKYNQNSDDIVVFKVTSKGGDYPFDISLKESDVNEGKLKYESSIQVDFPVVIEKRSITGKIGKIPPEKLSEVKQKMREFYEL